MKKRSIDAVALACLLSAISGACDVQTVDPERELLGLLPETTRSVVFVDAAALRDSDAYVRFFGEGTAPELPEPLADVATVGGNDLSGGLEQAVVGAASPDDMLAVIRVSFDTEAIEESLRDSGMASEIVGAYTIYRLPEDDPFGVTLVGDDTVILGQHAAVQAAIEGFPAGRGALDNAELTAAIAEVEPGFPVWGAGRFADLVPRDVAPPTALDLIEATGDIRFHDGVDDAFTVQATAAFATPEAALRTVDLLNGLLAFAAVGSATEAPEVAELVRAVQVAAQEDSVELSFSASWELLERAARSIGADASQPAGP